MKLARLGDSQIREPLHQLAGCDPALDKQDRPATLGLGNDPPEKMLRLNRSRFIRAASPSGAERANRRGGEFKRLEHRTEWNGGRAGCHSLLAPQGRPKIAHRFS